MPVENNQVNAELAAVKSCTLSSKSTRYVGKGIIETCLSDGGMGYTDHSQPPRVVVGIAMQRTPAGAKR
jgi:hypothetical protein